MKHILIPRDSKQYTALHIRTYVHLHPNNNCQITVCAQVQNILYSTQVFKPQANKYHKVKQILVKNICFNINFVHKLTQSSTTDEDQQCRK